MKNKKEIEDGAEAIPTNRMTKRSQVKVRAVKWVGEDGQTHPPGAEFEVTAQRRAALGALVEDVG